MKKLNPLTNSIVNMLIIAILLMSNYQIATAFTEPTPTEIKSVVDLHSIDEKEAFTYLWGKENQKREASGLEPLPLPWVAKKSISKYKIGNNPNSLLEKELSFEKNNSIHKTSIVQPGEPTSIDFTTYSQENLYYCGPAATKMALAAKGRYITPWGSTITQSLLANDNYLETDSYGYTRGDYIKYTLNTILETSFYIYKEVSSNNAGEMLRCIRLDHMAGYAPVLAVWQTPNSDIRLIGYPKDNYDLRHYITSDYTSSAYADTAYVGYRDPLYGWSNVYSGVTAFNVPYKSFIKATDLSWLNSGGSIIY